MGRETKHRSAQKGNKTSQHHGASNISTNNTTSTCTNVPNAGTQPGDYASATPTGNTLNIFNNDFVEVGYGSPAITGYTPAIFNHALEYQGSASINNLSMLNYASASVPYSGIIAPPNTPTEDLYATGGRAGYLYIHQPLEQDNNTAFYLTGDRPCLSWDPVQAGSTLAAYWYTTEVRTVQQNQDLAGIGAWTDEVLDGEKVGAGGMDAEVHSALGKRDA